jgi:thiamine biosynthesis lipoprotein
MSAQLVERTFRAVGTSCRVAATADSADTGRAQRALDAAIEEVAACEAALSRFDTSSDLSRLNAAAGSWVEVDERLAESLRLALRARDETHGRFDPTILPALVAAGYDRSFEKLGERPPRPADGWRAGATVEVGGHRARIGAGAAVDLGGIGKGYAAGRALAAMRDAWPLLPGGVVDLGGDLALAGAPPGDGSWRIDVVDPRGGRPAARLAVAGGGVATSGRDVRRFGPHRSLHHLIDPSTGAPAVPGPLAVTVVAADPVDAEVHATVLAISSSADAATHVAAHPQISALFVPHVGPPIALGRLPLARTRVLVGVAA